MLNSSTDKEYINLCICILKNDGMKLQYIKNQNEEICLTAIKQNINAISYVNEITPSIYKLYKEYEDKENQEYEDKENQEYEDKENQEYEYKESNNYKKSNNCIESDNIPGATGLNGYQPSSFGNGYIGNCSNCNVSSYSMNSYK